MFQVFEDDKPADVTGFPQLRSWKNSKFATFEEAQDYANDWLGEFGGIVLKLNEPQDYSGYGSFIEIREIGS